MKENDLPGKTGKQSRDRNKLKIQSNDIKHKALNEGQWLIEAVTYKWNILEEKKSETWQRGDGKKSRMMRTLENNM